MVLAVKPVSACDTTLISRKLPGVVGGVALVVFCHSTPTLPGSGTHVIVAVVAPGVPADRLVGMLQEDGSGTKLHAAGKVAFQLVMSI